MLRFSTAMIAIVTLAGVAHAAPGVATVPNYNIKAACQALSLVPEARSIDWTQSDATQRCLDAEQLAREQLVKEPTARCASGCRARARSIRSTLS